MSHPPRERAVTRIRSLLLREHSPRLQMTLVVVLTGLAGFLASAALLQIGMDSMALRYPISALIAYVAFLGMVWTMVKQYRVRVAPHLTGEERVRPILTASDEDSSDIPDLGDVGRLADSDEGCAVVAALVACLALLGVAGYLIVTAPTLLAELVLDSFVVTGLYRRLRDLSEGEWFLSAVTRTLLPAAVLVVLLCVAGAAFSVFAPRAHSLAGVIEEWRARR
ncbi:MAG: hypothetical protein HYY93_10400 [Planctomycetes bacterium]|nr:hypothetical protein [Planctomycetota bacterium]